MTNPTFRWNFDGLFTQLKLSPVNTSASTGAIPATGPASSAGTRTSSGSVR
jgi:hypothetical protein